MNLLIVTLCVISIIAVIVDLIAMFVLRKHNKSNYDMCSDFVEWQTYVTGILKSHTDSLEVLAERISYLESELNKIRHTDDEVKWQNN